MLVGHFTDRADAGRQLARRLKRLHLTDVVVLGLARGGVPVAAEVASALAAPLDVIVVRKLGVPFQPELAMGAIGEDDARWVDADLVARLRIPRRDVEAVERRERATLEERVALFRADHDAVHLAGRTAVIVDDGIATGATASVACDVARRRGATRVIVAAPVGSPDAISRVRGADEVICLVQPSGFRAVGAYYLRFDQTPESEVVSLLALARLRQPPQFPAPCR